MTEISYSIQRKWLLSIAFNAVLYALLIILALLYFQQTGAVVLVGIVFVFYFISVIVPASMFRKQFKYTFTDKGIELSQPNSKTFANVAGSKFDDEKFTITYDDITKVSINYGVFGRLLGIGNLYIRTKYGDKLKSSGDLQAARMFDTRINRRWSGMSWGLFYGSLVIPGLLKTNAKQLASIIKERAN